MKRVLTTAALLMVAGCTTLSTPPIDTPHASSTITLNQMSGGKVPTGVAAPIIVPAIPSFQVNPPEGMAIDVPSNATSVNLSAATLHIKLTNRMQIPLTLQLALSKTATPYSDASASLTPTPITLQASESKQIDVPVETTLFKQPKLYLGVSFGTPGTVPNVVTISGDDAVTTETWATVQVKVL